MSNNPHETSGNAPEENNSEENDNSGSTYFIGPRVVIDDEHEIVQNQIRLQIVQSEHSNNNASKGPW